LGDLAGRLPRERLGDDHRLIRLQAGESGLEVLGEAGAVTATAAFDPAYAVRSIADLVPNAFTAWSLIDNLLDLLRGRGWDDADFGRLASFIVDELRKELAGERERQAEALFAAGLEAGRIEFALR